MAFLQESALKETLESFSMLPKARTICCTVVLVPVTGCSPWDDFVALRCQTGQQALALGHAQVLDDRGLSHSQLDQINWCYICHGKVQCIFVEQRNGIFLT